MSNNQNMHCMMDGVYGIRGCMYVVHREAGRYGVTPVDDGHVLSGPVKTFVSTLTVPAR